MDDTRAPGFGHRPDRPRYRGVGASLSSSSWVGTPDDIRARVDASAEAGVTEVMYTPAGPDVEREIRAFAAATVLS